MVKCRRLRRGKFNSWVGKIPWRRKWQPTPVFSPGESYEQKNLEGYSPRGCKESDTTEYTCMHAPAVKAPNHNHWTVRGFHVEKIHPPWPLVTSHKFLQSRKLSVATITGKGNRSTEQGAPDPTCCHCPHGPSGHRPFRPTVFSGLCQEIILRPHRSSCTLCIFLVESRKSWSYLRWKKQTYEARGGRPIPQ